MRIFWRLLIGLLLALPIALATAFWLAVDATPAVDQAFEVSSADVGRVYALLRRHGPGRNTPGQLRAAVLLERDVELLLAQAAGRLGSQARPRVRFQDKQAWLQLSLALPANPVGGWLNLQAELAQTDRLPQVQRLRAGRLPLPGWLAGWLIQRVVKAKHLEGPSELALRMVNRVSFAQQLVVVAFAWPDGPVRQTIADTLLPAEDQARLRVYTEHLAGWLQQQAVGAGQSLPLSRLLPPLFDLARQRLSQGGPAASAPAAAPDTAGAPGGASTPGASMPGAPGSAAQEHRALLLALTLGAGPPGTLTRLVPAAGQWRPLPAYTLTLRGRDDFALHFLVSAVLAAEAGGPLSHAVGLFKEVADSQGGSGFSFNDIAADRAGTRFGLRAVQSPERLAAQLGPALRDEDLLPPVDDLPEYLTAAEFKRRYGGVDAPAYRAAVQDIDARLDRLPLLGPGGR